MLAVHAASIEPTEQPVFRRFGDENTSGVSWGAVIGGAFVTAALSLILLALGAGFGLSAVSPWSNVGASAQAVGAAAIVWLILTEIVASALGGYLAGRLRIRWRSIHTDEVHFRDTANGFLAWAVAVVVTVAFLAAGAASMVGSATGGGGEAAVQGSSPSAYFVDRLFRSDHPTTSENDPMVRAEAMRIFDYSVLQEQSSPADSAYLTQLVATKTGLGPADAQKRVDDTLAEARADEDAARKATAHLLLWLFVALLAGAFCASFAATIGGRQRDHVQAI
ncbi:MAG TPA: hypothetical protein VFW44_12220 [Bryobacteraceae bacterium]|nr:hypothetical protein [Bryobacteraceae bacterium]